MSTAEAVGSERGGGSVGRLVTFAVVSYLIYEIATDILHGVLEAIDPGDNPDEAEWARRQPLLDQLIFGGGPPDDDDQFRALLERAILYGGLTAVALAKMMGISRMSLDNWRKGSSPGAAGRRGAYELLRDVILKR